MIDPDRPVAPASDEPRMGSEYANARAYLTRLPRVPSQAPAVRSTEDAHLRANDTEFGAPASDDA